MTTPRRSPGRPLQFDDTARQQYLTAVTEGATLTEAARTVHLTVQAINKHARTNPSFAAALEVARTHGRKARAERMPHGESRYKHAACHCPICTTAATTARTKRRNRHTHTTPEDTTPDQAPVLQLPHAAAQKGQPLPLARAS
ncbi:hypothetical protein ABZ383_32090 [Streptomyces sp. NPDC005900]|uniref:hypothetical protein n=1 Tax=Streptomyces sp. NPDC005900 TaxID=3154569 RepID=UPI0034020171